MCSHILGHSFKLNHVYVHECASVCGIDEYKGPLGEFFDKHYENYHCNTKNFECAERKMLEDALYICLDKNKEKAEHIDLYLGGDLLNQNATVHYLARDIPSPFIGIYSACSSFTSTIILMSLLIEGKMIQKGISLVSSHNATAERQYRYPVEYGIQKRNTSTFTATGATALLLSDVKSNIRVESVTIGRVIDYKQKNPNDMGRAMAPSAYDTINSHFKDLNRTYQDYDLIVTGDLSLYGSSILKEMFKKDGIELDNYNDCGNMLYHSYQEVFQGGSGCACSALVTVGYLIKLLKNGTLKKVLIVSTGALLSPVMSAQKESIPSVAHAIVLEAI